MKIAKLSRFLIAIGILFSLAVPYSVYADSPETQTDPSGSQPEISILSTSDSSIELHVSFPENPLAANEDGTVFDEEIYSHPSESGAPDLPVLRKEIEISSGTEYNVEILSSTSYTGVLGENGLPGSIPERAQEVVKCEPGEECEETEDEPSPDSADLYPATQAEIINTYVIRGHQVAQMQFSPVQYNAAEQTVEIYQDMTIRINIRDEGARSASTNNAVQTSAAFDVILSDQIINYSKGTQIESDRSGSGEMVLIISPDGFLSTLSSLVTLKESQGFAVTLVGLSSIGSSTTEIKAYIQNAYDSWSNPPTYVILVGDVNNGSLTMPAFTGESSSSVTDLYYGTVDGTDWIPDIFVGRLPARSTSQLSTMINNLSAYNNLTGSESWVKKASFIGSSDSNYYYVAEATHNYVINSHTISAGYTGTYPSSGQAGGDKLYAITYSAGTSSVVNAVNNQRSLIVYSGHGSRSSWGGPYFNQTNIRNISSSGVFSVVASFACITGDFSSTESYGETWLLQSNKGAVAFIGSSASTFWGPDDTLERAMMDALYGESESANVIGYFRYAGLMAVEAQRPGTGTAQSRYYWESYNLFGDPSLEVLTEPKPLADYMPVLSSSSVKVGQAPGQDAVVYLTLTNAGANPDLYQVDLTPGVWTYSVRSGSSIELAPGESTTLEIVVTVPDDASFGQIEEYVLDVTSQNDNGDPPAKDSTTIELMASVMSYIPVINSP